MLGPLGNSVDDGLSYHGADRDQGDVEDQGEATESVAEHNVEAKELKSNHGKR